MANQDQIRAALEPNLERNGIAEYADAIMQIGYIESRFNTSAANPSSSAEGIWQFIDSTWTGEGGGNKFSVDDQARNIASFTRKNIESFEKSNGRLPDGAELYLAHFGGVGVANKTAQAIANGRGGENVSSILSSQQISANRGIKLNGKSFANFTVQDLYDWSNQKMDGIMAGAAGLVDRINQLQIETRTRDFYNNVEASKDEYVAAVLNQEGREAIMSQLAARNAAKQLGITIDEARTAKLDAEAGLMSEEKLKEYGIGVKDENGKQVELTDEQKEKIEALDLVTIDGKTYSGAKTEFKSGGEEPSETEALLHETGKAYLALPEEERQKLKEAQEQKIQQQYQNTKDHMVAAAGASGMSEEMMLLAILGAAFAYASGNKEAGDQILNNVFGAAAGTGPSTYQSSPYSPTQRGYRNADGTSPNISDASRDVLSGQDLGAQGFTNNPNKPFWVALNADGKPVAGNMAFEPATPMSTTKMATLLTISDMIKAGELSSDFLERHASDVHAMMQRSSNEAPDNLAAAAVAESPKLSGSSKTQINTAFAGRMNQMAEERGLKGTHYGSPTGLNAGDRSWISDRTYTTAHDAAQVAYSLRHDHEAIALEYAAVGEGHTGRRFRGMNGIVTGKTGTGNGGEGRGAVGGGRKAFIGTTRNGGAFAALEMGRGTEYGTYVGIASRTAYEASKEDGIDVAAKREEVKAKKEADEAKRISGIEIPAALRAQLAEYDKDGNNRLEAAEQSAARDALGDEAFKKAAAQFKAAGVEDSTPGGEGDKAPKADGSESLGDKGVTGGETKDAAKDTEGKADNAAVPDASKPPAPEEAVAR